MDRYAIFVDADYLYTEGGLLCCNSSDRHDILLYGLGANDVLMGVASDLSGQRPLRTYWYDTSGVASASSAQKLLATLPNMKLRLESDEEGAALSPISAGIHRDLLTLSKAGAICDAFMLTADTRLVNTVNEVQDTGVRVTVINVASPQNPNRLSRLAIEADEVVRLSKDELSRFIRRRRAPDDASTGTYDPVESVAVAATDFAENWLYRASDDEFDRVLDHRPRIPESLDGDLLYFVENVIGGSLRGQDRLRRAIRQAFWRRVDLEIEG